MPEDTGADDGRAGVADPAERVHNPERSPWVWLLAVPVLLLIYPPLYNRADPELFGMPFFYWYQLATVPVAVLSTSAVFLLTRRPR